MTSRRSSRSVFAADSSSLDFVARLWMATAVAAWAFWLVPLAVVWVIAN